MYLIVDNSEKETVFLTSNNGNFCPVKKLVSAVHFNSEKAAKNIINNCIPKILRSNYNWKVVLTSSLSNSNCNEDNSGIQNQIDHVVAENVSEELQYIPVRISEIKELVEDLSDKLSALKGNKEYLLQEESDVDKAISDVLHYIEFYTFDACSGYKLCKLLKELRLYRREIKNEIELSDNIFRHTCNNVAKGDTFNFIKGLENKKYKPRILCDLFDDKDINKALKLVKEFY